MALELPSTLSPSKMESFTSCGLAFRFSVIDRLPEPPSPAAVRGTLVHRALELLFLEAPHDRTPAAALAALHRAHHDLRPTDEWLGLGLDGAAEATLLADAHRLVETYFRLEDPTAVRPIGLELMLEAEVEGVRLRGIIDRLELDERGDLVITDYKTGRSPSERHEAGRLSSLQFYAVLCREVLGRTPARVQLLYLGDGVAISTDPSDRSMTMLVKRVGAVWAAVRRACDRNDFRPKPGPLCNYCAFRDRCPAWGGDEEAAGRVELVAR